MSRIRSVHPGFFTDDRLVACSAFARLLFIGLGVEADDKGIFEWKPLTIKMLVFPGDNLDIGALLGELETADAIRSYEIDGRKYGAIRNFRKFQRPKTPNNIHPITPEFSKYVGLTAPASETPPDEVTSFPPKGENSPQMEDGGGRVKEKDVKPASHSEPLEARDFLSELFQVFPRNPKSSDTKAAKAFKAISLEDRPSTVEAAKRYRQWFLADCISRKRSSADGLEYVPHLSTWLTDDAWRAAFALSVPNAPTAEQQAALDAVVTLYRWDNEKLFKACERLREKPAPTDRFSFPKEIVAAARAEIGAPA